MNATELTHQKLSVTPSASTAPLVDGRELEELVSAGLVNDINGQLADISKGMQDQLEQKQNIRAEMETLYTMRTHKEILNIEGQSYVDLDPEEAQFLDLIHTATPQTDPNGNILGYRIKEEQFDEATDSALKSREEKLSDLNSNGELTMLKIQSLVDQRKNALTLLSNLLRASNDIAQTIINNIRS
jgi:hypothetical protein